MFDFAGKVAIVTGGGGGIGRAAATALARSGAKVAVVDISRDLGAETVRLIKEQGAEAIYVYADVSKSEDVQNYVKETVDAYGRIDVLINNAAWEGIVSRIQEYPEDTFDKIMSINVKGVYLGLKYVLPVMIAQRSGAVVNTGSVSSYVGHGGISAYTASKHAVLGLTKVAAIEVGKLGIRVNAVCPGSINTRMLASIEELGKPGAADVLRQKNITDTVDGRIGEPEEVANLMLYLASDMASHITGQSIRIDGGQLMM